MKMIIENISFKEYSEADEERREKYDYYIKYCKQGGRDIFRLGQFEDQSFGTVKDFQAFLNGAGLDWITFFNMISKLTGIHLKKIAEYSIFRLQEARLYIKNEIDRINLLESENLGHVSMPMEAAAGVEVFQKYGAFLQIDTLAGGDPTKYEQIKALNYSICFTKLLLEKDRNEYFDRYSKLSIKKH
jgi:hypothetical protein